LTEQSIIFGMGREFEGAAHINSADKSFIEFLEANTDSHTMTDIHASLSMTGDQMIGRAKDLIDRLDQYKVEPSRASLPVKKAWVAMDNFIASKAEYLQENGITPIVYGSMAFDDAQLLDFDLCLLGENDLDMKDELKKWERELAESWKNVGVKGHIEYVSFETLERYGKAFREDRADLIDEIDADIFFDGPVVLPVLIGTYPYTDQEEAKKHKERFFEIVQQCPSLLAFTIWNVAEVLMDRETRRAGVFHRQTGEDKYMARYFSEKFGIPIDKMLD
jgi:hypothetical protein